MVLSDFCGIAKLELILETQAKDKVSKLVDIIADIREKNLQPQILTVQLDHDGGRIDFYALRQYIYELSKYRWSPSSVQFSRTLWEMNREGATLAPAASAGENAKKNLKKAFAGFVSSRFKSMILRLHSTGRLPENDKYL